LTILAIYKHNRPLREQMLNQGFTWFDNGKHQYFRKPNNEFYGFPPGYIRGPHIHDNGNPRRYQFSVKLADGMWSQRNFKAVSEGITWALKRAKEILNEERK